MTSLREKSTRGLFWDLTGKLSLQGVGFIVSIILARILAPEDFGIIAIVTVFLNLSYVFLDFGFSTAIVQKKEVNQTHYSAVFYMNLVMGLVLAGIVFLLAPLISRFYHKEILVNLTRLMSLNFIINSFGNVIRARLRREMDFKTISISNLSGAVISGTTALIMAFKGMGVWSLAIQGILNQLVANIILYLLTRYHLSLKFNWSTLKELWPFSSRVFYSGFLDTLFYSIDNLFIGKLLSPAILGYYNRAKSIEFLGLKYTASVIGTVLLPGLSQIQDDHDRLKDTITRIFNLLMFSSLLGCGLLLTSGRELIILVFSEKWEPSVMMFQIIIIGAFGSQVSSLFINTILSTGRANDYLFINVINKALILIDFVVLYFWKLTPYLIGYTIIQIINFLIQMTFITRQLNFGNLLWNRSIKYLSVYALSIVGTFMIKLHCGVENQIILLLITLPTYLAIYVLFSLIFKTKGLALVIDEVKILKNRFAGTIQ